MDDEQIKALFERRDEFAETLGNYILAQDWKGYSPVMQKKYINDVAEALILEGWIDLKLPQKAIINQFNHPPGVRSADQV